METELKKDKASPELSARIKTFMKGGIAATQHAKLESIKRKKLETKPTLTPDAVVARMEGIFKETDEAMVDKAAVAALEFRKLNFKHHVANAIDRHEALRKFENIEITWAREALDNLKNDLHRAQFDERFADGCLSRCHPDDMPAYQALVDEAGEKMSQLETRLEYETPVLEKIIKHQRSELEELDRALNRLHQASDLHIIDRLQKGPTLIREGETVEQKANEALNAIIDSVKDILYSK